MGFLGRLSRLGKGLWKVKTTSDPEFSDALEEELENMTTAQQKARAKARLDHLRGGESSAPGSTEDEAGTEAGSDEEKPSLENPPKKTL